VYVVYLDLSILPDLLPVITDDEVYEEKVVSECKDFYLDLLS
jgi:hypothetical protein